MCTCKAVNKRTSDFDVYIGRPSKWGNPFVVGRDGARDECCRKYAENFDEFGGLANQLDELVGKKLGCFCKPANCHGDFLAMVANEYQKSGDSYDAIRTVKAIWEGYGG